MTTSEVRAVAGHGFEDDEVFFKTLWSFCPDAHFIWLAERNLKSARDKLQEYLASIGINDKMTSAERQKLMRAKAVRVDRDMEQAGLALTVEKISGHSRDGESLTLDCVWTTGETIATPLSAFPGDKSMLNMYVEKVAKLRGAATTTNTGVCSRPVTTVPVIGTQLAIKKEVTPVKTPIPSAEADTKAPVSKIVKAVVKQAPKSSQAVIRKKAATVGPIIIAAAVASPASPAVADAAGASAPEILCHFKDKKAVTFLVVEDNSGSKLVEAKEFQKQHPEAYVAYLEKNAFDSLV